MWLVKQKQGLERWRKLQVRGANCESASRNAFGPSHLDTNEFTLKSSQICFSLSRTDQISTGMVERRGVECQNLSNSNPLSCPKSRSSTIPSGRGTSPSRPFSRYSRAFVIDVWALTSFIPNSRAASAAIRKSFGRSSTSNRDFKGPSRESTNRSLNGLHFQCK